MEKPSSSATVGRIAQSFLSEVAGLFPIAAYSDEFYFFPQALQTEKDWSHWDDFSDEAVGAFTSRCRAWEVSLQHALSGCRPDVAVDARCLASAMKTLREQFETIGPHRCQPTFHLTVAAAGFAEALASGEEEAWRARSGGLPAFLDRAGALLQNVPRVFLAAGVTMAADFAAWLEVLPGGGAAARVVKGFSSGLGKLRGFGSFLLPEGHYDHLLRRHYGFGVGPPEALQIVEAEIKETEDSLFREGDLLGFGQDWREAALRIPPAVIPEEGAVELYRREAVAMRKHCLATGLQLPGPVLDAPLWVECVPPALEAVRASDAYQSLPGVPPRGGIFFVSPRSSGGRQGPTLEYRMTCAHETWPGHHLLDACRWSSGSPLRRSLELPFYYEGWACLAEELMAVTGYLDGPWDRFIGALRRLKRAVRGKVDIGMQTGVLAVDGAAALLVEAGFPPEEAVAALPKFALRPGYQVCYTLGLRRFRDLLDISPRDTPWMRARRILEEGEVGFDEIERNLGTRGA